VRTEHLVTLPSARGGLPLRLAILTQYYPPETGAPQARLGDLAARLAARGHEVVVLTAMPNYPSGRVQPEWQGRVVARERRDGVDVRRSWIAPTATRSTPRQLWTYATFAGSVTVTAPFRLRSADVLLWESPPLFLAPTAYLVARRLGARLVMNVSDLWPKAAADLGVLHEGRLLSAFERLERWAYRRAALVSCQTEGVADGVREREPAAHTVVFPNGVDVARFDRARVAPADRAALGLKPDAFLVGYVGNFGRFQALDQVVDAASALRHRDDIRFVMIGAGPCRDEIVQRAATLDNVRVLDAVPNDRVAPILATLDAAVVPLADVPVQEGARPAKMFELAALEVPFVYCGGGEGAAIARACAMPVVPPEQPAALAAAIETMAATPAEERAASGRTARAHVIAHFDRAVIAERMERVLEGLCEAATPRRRGLEL
jgi:glycosyltransferase involved in cell wall biosynthesis